MMLSPSSPPLSTPTFLRLTFSRRDLLPLQPHTLWRIERGAVRGSTWSVGGEVITIGYWGVGDVVGKPLSNLELYQLECITGVELSCVPSHLWHQMLDSIIAHTQQTEELLNIVRQERIYQRLHQFLWWLAQKFGRQVSSGQLIDLRLTHQAIAETLGTTRVTITRLLKDFEREGIITRQERYHLIVKTKSSS